MAFRFFQSPIHSLPLIVWILLRSVKHTESYEMLNSDQVFQPTADGGREPATLDKGFQDKC